MAKLSIVVNSYLVVTVRSAFSQSRHTTVAARDMVVIV